MTLHQYLSLTAVAASFAIVRPASADDATRGTLLRSVALGHLEPAEVAARVTSAGFDASAVRLGVDLYRLEYRTIDPDGHPIMASGLLAIPADHADASIAVSFTHGTELARTGAPSASVNSD